MLQFANQPKSISDNLYERWRKRIFANDVITCKSLPDGNEEIIITRGKYEACITISPFAYQNPCFMLDADRAMRFVLRRNKERRKEKEV